MCLCVYGDPANPREIVPDAVLRKIQIQIYCCTGILSIITYGEVVGCYLVPCLHEAPEF